MRRPPMHRQRRALRAAAWLAASQLCACATPTPPQPSQPIAPPAPAQPATPATPPQPTTDAPPAQPPTEPATAPASPPQPTEPTTAAASPPQPARSRECTHGERLDTGCKCSSGACFDICCGPNADCAHPLDPGGPSACMLRPLRPPTPPPEPRACKNGESLADGCECKHTTCMDICCVDSACSHHPSPDGGWSKCMSLPKRSK